MHMVAALSVVLILGPVASGQRGLSGAQRRQVDEALDAVRNGTEARQQAALRDIALFGEPLRAHLRDLSDRQPERREIADLLKLLDRIEGRDLETADVGAHAVPWASWVVPAGEVIVLRGKERWAGVRVDASCDPASGTIMVDVVESTDPLLPFGGPGVTRTRREIKGREVSVPGPRSAFPVRDFSIDVLGEAAVLRSTGSAAFRYALSPGAPPAARTGTSDLRRVKGGDPKLRFEDGPDEKTAAGCRRVQQYLFRLVDGLEPLPTYGTEDEARFASAEQVQVETREDTAGRRVLLVAFPHSDESVPYDGVTHALLERFVARVLGMPPADILVWVGRNEAHEANWFYDGGQWKQPQGRLRDRIRALFPEDY